jgi:CheY-like chemotaxis protein
MEPSKPLIFLVEDNEFFAQSVTLGLEHRGLETVWLSNGAAMLNLLKIRRPDVIILDYQLEEEEDKALNGGHYLEILKALYPTIPVLMLTGLTDTQEAVKLLKTGAVDFIAKDDNFFENLFKSLSDLIRARELSGSLKSTHVQLKKLNKRLTVVLITVAVAIIALLIIFS